MLVYQRVSQHFQWLFFISRGLTASDLFTARIRPWLGQSLEKSWNFGSFPARQVANNNRGSFFFFRKTIHDFSYGFSHGFSMIFPFSYGFPMVFPWFFHGFPMVFLWFDGIKTRSFHRFPRRFAQDSIVKAVEEAGKHVQSRDLEQSGAMWHAHFFLRVWVYNSKYIYMYIYIYTYICIYILVYIYIYNDIYIYIHI